MTIQLNKPITADFTADSLAKALRQFISPSFSTLDDETLDTMFVLILLAKTERSHPDTVAQLLTKEVR